MLSGAKRIELGEVDRRFVAGCVPFLRASLSGPHDGVNVSHSRGLRNFGVDAGQEALCGYVSERLRAVIARSLGLNLGDFDFSTLGVYGPGYSMGPGTTDWHVDNGLMILGVLGEEGLEGTEIAPNAGERFAVSGSRDLPYDVTNEDVLGTGDTYQLGANEFVLLGPECVHRRPPAADDVNVLRAVFLLYVKRSLWKRPDFLISERVKRVMEMVRV